MLPPAIINIKTFTLNKCLFIFLFYNIYANSELKRISYDFSPFRNIKNDIFGFFYKLNDVRVIIFGLLTI